MSKNEQAPEPADQDQDHQTADPDPLFAGEQQYAGYVGPLYPQYAEAGHHSAELPPVDQAGARAVSMTFLVIGYVLGGFLFLAMLLDLPEIVRDAGDRGILYSIIGTVFSLAVPGFFALLVYLMHRWRGRIKRRERGQLTH